MSTANNEQLDQYVQRVATMAQKLGQPLGVLLWEDHVRVIIAASTAVLSNTAVDQAVLVAEEVARNCSDPKEAAPALLTAMSLLANGLHLPPMAKKSIAPGVTQFDLADCTLPAPGDDRTPLMRMLEPSKN